MKLLEDFFGPQKTPRKFTFDLNSLIGRARHKFEAFLIRLFFYTRKLHKFAFHHHLNKLPLWWNYCYYGNLKNCILILHDVIYESLSHWWNIFFSLQERFSWKWNNNRRFFSLFSSCDLKSRVFISLKGSRRRWNTDLNGEKES